MTDRELLELAAKAAGYALCTWPGESTLRAEIEPGWRPVWNPLESDGDALRLAVKLGMVLDIRYAAPSMKFNCVNYWPIGEEAKPYRQIYFDMSDDSLAASRRAIVRAAAEIGRAMP